MATKVFSITHIDLDGIASYKVLEHLFGKTSVDVYFMNYPFNDHHLDIIKRYLDREEYGSIFITDLSFKSSDKEWLEKFKDIVKDKTVMWIDHHESSDIELGKKYFTDVHVDKSNNYAGSGLTFQLFKDFLNNKYDKKELDLIHKFNTTADHYDLWKLDEYWERGQELTDLYEHFSPYDIKNWSIKELIEPESDIVLRQLLKSINGKKKYSLQKCEENKFTSTVKGHSVALTYCNTYRNYIAHNMKEDVILMVNPTSLSISMRSRTEEIQVHKFCEQYGGGGHVLAAGVRLDKELIFNPIQLLKQFKDFYHE